MYIRSVVLAAVALLAAVVRGARDAELLRPCYRNVSGDAKAELVRLARVGAAWKPSDGRTRMFVRGQFYYGNQYAHYIHAWYERPLHQDSSMSASNEQGRMLNEKSWRRTVQTAREMKLDGFAFFPMNPGCMDLFPRSQMPGATVPLLMQFTSSNLAGGFDECVRLAERYRAMPNAYRLDGKPVIVGYPEIAVGDTRMLDVWKGYRRTLAEKFGADSFVIMPSVRLFDFHDLDRPSMELPVIRKVQERIREVLRAFDGLYIGQWECSWGPPANLAKPTDEIVTPLVRGVLAEPEFRGKHLGYEFYQAHENPYRRVADLPSGGLTRLMTALASIEKMQPDFAFGSEWDEENENVHFRPTVSNGQTTQRIMRYFADRMAGVAPTPYPGDTDTSVPNVIVAYRKMLAVGEPAEVQVACVPDGTAEGDYTVSFRWKTPDGATVRSYGPVRLPSRICKVQSFMTPSTELADHRLLLPELTVQSAKGIRQVFADGFWPMSIEATRVLDNKWVRQALREICTDVEGTLEIGAKAPDGTYEVRGRVKGPRKFRSIEVLETSDSVYMHDAKEEQRTDGELIMASFHALGDFWRMHSPTGWVRLLGAPHAEPHAGNPSYAVAGGPMEWLLPTRSMPQWNFFSDYGFRVSPDELETAELEIGLLPELGVKRVRVSDVVRKGTYSFALPGGGQVVVRRKLVRADIPPPPLVDSCVFSFRMQPLDPAANLRLQVVDEDYRIWRGPWATFYRPSGKTETIHVYDETSCRTQSVKVDRSRLYALRYDFGKCRGDMVDTLGGRSDSPCVFGGSIARVTGVGAGYGAYQNVLSEGVPNYASLPGGDDTAPRAVQEADGGWSLRFTNSNYASLPMQFVPRHSGFELSMRILPEDGNGVSWLLDSGNVGFQLFLRDGVPEAFLSFSDEMFRAGVNETAGIRVKGARLDIGRWNALKVVFTQNEAWIEVNGVAGPKVAGRGHENNPLVMALGCSHGGRGGFFRGRLADLRMLPR